MRLWVIDHTVCEHGRESSFTTGHAADASARRMVANLLADRLPGESVEEHYTQDLN